MRRVRVKFPFHSRWERGRIENKKQSRVRLISRSLTLAKQTRCRGEWNRNRWGELSYSRSVLIQYWERWDGEGEGEKERKEHQWMAITWCNFHLIVIRLVILLSTWSSSQTLTVTLDKLIHPYSTLSLECFILRSNLSPLEASFGYDAAASHMNIGVSYARVTEDANFLPTLGARWTSHVSLAVDFD